MQVVHFLLLQKQPSSWRFVARVSKILRKNWSILKARKTLLKLQEVYWKETIRDAQTGHSIKQAAKKGIKEESLVIVC